MLALDTQKAVTQFKQDTWQVERGLMQKAVNAICQSHDGYIWLGTSNGLVRFDGIRFKTFNKENTEELLDNFIRILVEDGKGNLWIGTENGGLSCLKEGKFITYTLEKYPGLQRIFTIFQDQDGSLWVGTLNSGLTFLKNGKFTTYTVENGLASNKVMALHQDKNGLIWIATSAGLSIRDSSGRIRGYTSKDGPFDKYILSICKTKKEELWLGCLDGLYCLKEGKVTYYGKKEGLKNLKIGCLYEDNDENLWAGTENGGLIRVKNGRIETFPPGDELAIDDINSIHEDREKNLWIGTLKGGLRCLRDTVFTPYTTREGLSHNLVHCICKDKAGNLWIGTEYGVNQLKDDQLKTVLTTSEGLLSNRITAIMEDRNGVLWVGTDVGLNRYKNGKLLDFNFHNDGLNSCVLQLKEDQKGRIVILTEKNLSRFHEGKFTLLKKEESNNFLVRFCIDRENTIWLGTYGDGIFKLKDEKIIAITTEEGLVNNEVECIYEDKKGILYFGTRGGLSLLDKGKFINYTTRSGLLDSFIYQIVEDESGYLWLTGRIGFSRINKKELSNFAEKKIDKINPVLFDESDGIRDPFCNQSVKTLDGKLWFATEQGVMIIDPSKIKKKRQAPPVVIEELTVDGEVFPISEPMVILPGKKRLEFHYTGLSFVKSRQIKFKLKLEGYDSDWVDNGHNRSTTYTGLSPGKYTFRVTACNSDGVWNQEGASFSFYLKPYFWQTTWFFILCALAVISIGFIGYRLRVRQLKIRQKELTALIESRTREVENKNRQLEDQSEKLKEIDKIKSRFFANISHEFRTPLTLIVGPLEQMIAACGENEKETKRKLTLVLRNAQRLLRLINQLLELSKLESGKMKLQAVQTNIVSFLRGIADSFRFLAHQKELDLLFHTETEAEDIILYIDPRKMEDIMSNLLINALKFTPPGGKITVAINKSFCGGPGGDSPRFLEKSPLVAGVKKKFPGGSVEISVSDTGPGIPGEQLAHIFDRFFQADTTYEFHEKGSGIGLALCKELVELHHGTITVRSREDEGSEFIMWLPLGSEHLRPDEIVDLPAAQFQPPTNSKISEKITAMESVIEKEEKETGPEIDFEPKDKAVESNIILVVEDSADMRDYIRGALEPGYTVVDARDGREGIQKAQEIIPDLIISDIMMPEVDGYELCRVLKNDVQTSHIPIILLTAKASEENIIQGFETRADDYITKPFSTKILNARIKNLIDIRSQLQKNLNRDMTLQPVKTSVSRIDREFLQELQDVIKKNLSDPEFNVEKLCKKLYIGNTTLYRKIQALCGKTPTEFIRSCRLKRAAQLLESGFGSVTEVAFEVGFSSRTYFTKCFKERFQQLPSEYKG